MPITLANAREDLRSRLNETVAAFFADSDLNNWLNEGCRDIARRAKALQSKTSITVSSGNQTYEAPPNFVELHRLEFLPVGSQNVYPLEYRNYNEMDSIWGINQQIQNYYPNYWTLWQEPPNSSIILFPMPSADGTLNVFFFRTATAATADTMNLDVPEGWWDLAIVYALYTALFKTLDPRWQQMRQLYDTQMADMINAAGQYTDAVGRMTSGPPNAPMWQFGGFDAWS